MGRGQTRDLREPRNLRAPRRSPDTPSSPKKSIAESRRHHKFCLHWLASCRTSHALNQRPKSPIPDQILHPRIQAVATTSCASNLEFKSTQSSHCLLSPGIGLCRRPFAGDKSSTLVRVASLEAQVCPNLGERPYLAARGTYEDISWVIDEVKSP